MIERNELKTYYMHFLKVFFNFVFNNIIQNCSKQLSHVKSEWNKTRISLAKQSIFFSVMIFSFALKYTQTYIQWNRKLIHMPLLDCFQFRRSHMYTCINSFSISYLSVYSFITMKAPHYNFNKLYQHKKIQQNTSKVFFYHFSSRHFHICGHFKC